ncbi:MAG TPA: hypothetical protein VFS08_03270 [Gemmatimonadaceae bacterium]|nr:hypothetical protein [Gemmatimonadaceae bacterium]
MLRSVLAIVVGYLASAVLVLIGFTVLGRLAPSAVSLAGLAAERRPGIVFGVLLMDAVIAVVGGYVTALIARRAPIGHAFALGALMLLLGIVTSWVSPEREPTWYAIWMPIVVLPAAVIGGMIRARQTRGGPRLHVWS